MRRFLLGFGIGLVALSLVALGALPAAYEYARGRSSRQLLLAVVGSVIVLITVVAAMFIGNLLRDIADNGLTLRAVLWVLLFAGLAVALYGIWMSGPG